MSKQDEVLLKRLEATEHDLDRMVERVEKVAVELVTVAAGQETVQGELTSVKNAVKGLAGAVEDLGAAVKNLGGAGDKEEPDPPFCYLTSEDADGAGDALADLETWLDVVLAHYPGGVLQDCWRRHAWIVEELLVLREAHRVAWERGAPVTARLDWHNRWLPEVLRRITGKNGLRGCDGLLSHATEDWKPARQQGLDAGEAIVGWWVAEHGQTPPPAPTERALAEARAREHASLRG